MEQTKVEQALDLIFKDGSLLRDGDKFVGFLEHNYVFGYNYTDSLVVRSIDKDTEWLLAYIKDKFSTIEAEKSLMSGKCGISSTAQVFRLHTASCRGIGQPSKNERKKLLR